MRLWVRRSALCMDEGVTANALRALDVDCVRYWKRVTYAINSGRR
jgi:hypothetical protein